MLSVLTAAFALLLAQSPQAPAPGTPAHAPDADLVLRTQVALDRAGFSPGVIDGKPGRNTTRALAAFEQQGGTLDTGVEPLATYVITAADQDGAYTPEIPDDLMEQASLPALGYRDVVEALAERFHTTGEFLRARNPGCRFTAGESLLVPNVEPFVLPPEPDPARGTPRAAGRGRADREAAGDEPLVVTVSRSESAMTIADASGRVRFYAPVTTGSEHDPLPIGDWKVTGIHLWPTFHYNPDLFWDAEPTDSKTTLAAGPNNPVGLVWIDIDKPHYGLHGTPEPQVIGHVESHGCVRLTNWDAVRAAALLAPGTPVRFVE
jgi:lipoprotein-anchoring transpeptidase ErfK/SrfK